MNKRIAVNEWARMDLIFSYQGIFRNIAENPDCFCPLLTVVFVPAYTRKSEFDLSLIVL